MQDVGAVHLRVYPPGETEQQPDLVKVDVAIEGATIFIAFSLETDHWPFRIENDSDMSFSFCQSVRATYNLRIPASRQLHVGRFFTSWNLITHSSLHHSRAFFH